MAFPLCTTSKETRCMVKKMYDKLNTLENCPISCYKSRYYGKTRKLYERLEPTPNTMAICYIIFPSNRIAMEKEILIFGMIEIIGSIGGTLGLFLGFSFYDTLKYPIQKLFMNKGNYE